MAGEIAVGDKASFRHHGQEIVGVCTQTTVRYVWIRQTGRGDAMHKIRKEHARRLSA